MKITLLISLCFLINFHLYSQNVGIGVASPAEKLDVLGNLKFSGALMPNNLAGSSNQVLTTSGVANTPPTWADPSAGQMWTTVYSTDSINITYSNGATYSTIPGLTQTITVPSTGTYDAFIFTDGGVRWNNASAGSQTVQADMILYDGTTILRVSQLWMDNYMNMGNPERHWSFGYVIPNITGTHTFSVKANFRNIFKVGYSNTFTFGDKNLPDKTKVASLSVCLIRK